MPYVRVVQRMQLVRPDIPHQVGHPRMSAGYPRAPVVNRNHHHLPRHLPVLQPPFFPREYDPYEDDFEQELEYDEFYPDQRQLFQPQFTTRLLAYPLFPNIRPTRSLYPPYMYYLH